MTVQQLFRPWTERAHVHLALLPNDMQKIQLREFNLVIHQRTPDIQLQSAVKTLATSSFTKLELLVDTAMDFSLHIRQQLALRHRYKINNLKVWQTISQHTHCCFRKYVNRVE